MTRTLKPLHRQAFTLIEVLIAVVVSAIVLAAMNGVFYGAIRLREKTTRAVEEGLPIQQTLAVLKRDLQGIMAPGGMLAGTLQSGSGSSSMEQDAGTEIYTSTGRMDETSPWGDVQKAAYLLRSPTNRQARTGKDLIRAVTRNLLPTTLDEPEEQWLLGDVERLEFFYYSGTEWKNSWDSTTEESGLPKAIKVQIELGTNQAIRSGQRLIELVVPVTAQARTNK